MKTKMIAWVTGIILLIILLMTVIVSMEQPGEGISRAQASKALALALTDKEECESRAKERQSSWFSAKEKDNWFVMYMDYLYEEGYFDPQLTEASLKSAQKELTYQEAAIAAGKISGRLKSRVGMTKYNRTKPYPKEEWWSLYNEILSHTDEDGAVKQVEAVLYGTPSNLLQAESWTAYTTQGNFGFQGLALDTFIDCRIHFYARGSEMIAITGIPERDVVYENVWLSQADKETFRVYLGSTYRDFMTDGKVNLEGMAPNLVDITLKDGRLKDVAVKKDRISGKVLSVTEDAIELEGYGILPLSQQFHVYKVYGDFEVLGPEDILVGYDLQEFVAADGMLCAALMEREFDAKTIRVLLMDSGFSSIFHPSVEIALNCNATLEYETAGGKRKKQQLKAGDVVSLQQGDKRLEHGRLILTPEASEGLQLLSVERSHGNPVYSGRLELCEEPEGITIVNELYLEEYLAKVVPSEMPYSYEMEALKAQAVCARTYAYRQIQGNAYSQYGAHVDDSTSYQVYNNTQEHSRTTQAVNETYGKMLFYGGKPAEAFYYSTSCGRGTDASIWGSTGSNYPYLQAIEICRGGSEVEAGEGDFDSFIRRKDVRAWDSSFPMFRWETDIPASLLSGQIAGVGDVEEVAVTKRGAGGIASQITVTGNKGQAVIEGQSAIRSSLGNPALKIQRQDGTIMEGSATLPSAFISLEQRKAEDGSASFHVYGGGFGHGVGMSQNGAQEMAKNQLGYEEILAFFYQGTEIKNGSGQ